MARYYQLPLVFVWLTVCAALCGAAQRGVNPDQKLTTGQSCAGAADGTRCTKRCTHISCSPDQARCWQVLRYEGRKTDCVL